MFRRVILRAVLGLSAWGLCGAVQAAQPQPIRLGLIEGLSGVFANTGEAVYRNLQWAVERVNARGGVHLPAAQGGARPLALERLDSRGQPDQAVQMLRSAVDHGVQVVLQGNSSAVAAALVDAVNRHNAREPQTQVLFLNYAAVDPALTEAQCSFWHFRFDAHADMRMQALMAVLRDDRAVQKVFLIGQDYSFGQAVAREARRQITLLRPDVQIVADELHPVGRVKDFVPYAQRIVASGAQAVVTGNWGQDLTLLVKAARDVGFQGKFYTFYGNALGAPTALGEAGVGKVLAVAEWLPNVAGADSQAFYQAFKQRFPRPADDYVHLRMQVMVEALVQAIETSASADPQAWARALEGLSISRFGHSGTLRASDHQFQQPLVVGEMQRVGSPGVTHDVEGSGYGFRVLRSFKPSEIEPAQRCHMTRP